MKPFKFISLLYRTNVDSSGGEASASGGAMQLSAVGDMGTRDKTRKNMMFP